MPERIYSAQPRACRTAAWALLLAVCSVAVQVRAAEPGPAEAKPPSAETIKAWVKQLGDDDFQKRVEAQKALLGAGIAARAELEGALNATDPEVRNTARNLLDRIKWTALPAKVDYAALFPPETLMMVHLPGIAGTVKDSKGTAIMRLWSSEALKPLRMFFDKKIKESTPPGGQDGMAVFKEWAKCFEGQVAGGIISLQLGFGADVQGFVIAEITAEDPQAVYDKFLNETQMFLAGAGAHFEGLHIRTGLQDQGAVTLAGKHLIIGPNAEVVKAAARGLIQAEQANLLESPVYKKLTAQAGSKSDLRVFINMESYMKLIAGMGLPANLFEDMGIAQMEAIFMNTSVAGDVFEDRIAVSMKEGKPSGLTGLLTELQNVDPNRPVAKFLSIAPPGAVMAASSYLDGPATMAFMKDYIALMNKMQAQMPAGGGAMPEFNFEKLIQTAETKTGVKMQDFAANIKGDMVMWVSLKEELAPPDVGLALPCADAEKAKDVAAKLVPILSTAAREVLEQTAKEKAAMEALMQAEVEAVKKAEQEGAGGETAAEGEGEKAQPDAPAVPADAVFFNQIEKAGHMLFVEADASPLMKVPERMMLPYRICWAAHGDRVIVSSSVPGLLHRLKALDAGEAGFDAQKLAGPGVKIDGQMTGMSMIDLAQLLNYAAKHGLPIAAAQMGGEPDLQKLAQDLAAQEGLFKEMPPVVIVNQLPKDGVTTAVIRGPAPYLPSVFGAVFAGLFWQSSSEGMVPQPAIVAPPAQGP